MTLVHSRYTYRHIILVHVSPIFFYTQAQSGDFVVKG